MSSRSISPMSDEGKEEENAPSKPPSPLPTSSPISTAPVDPEHKTEHKTEEHKAEEHKTEQVPHNWKTMLADKEALRTYLSSGAKPDSERLENGAT
jgi:hypothetical protein